MSLSFATLFIGAADLGLLASVLRKSACACLNILGWSISTQYSGMTTRLISSSGEGTTCPEAES